MQELDRDIDVRDRSVGELVQRLSEQTATLVRQEMRLAQAEMKEKGKQAAVGAGLVGVGGVVALGAVGALVAGLILLVAEVVAAWVAALIVAVGLGAIAGATALAGKHEVAEAAPPKPEEAMESVRADVAEIKEKVRQA